MLLERNDLLCPVCAIKLYHAAPSILTDYQGIAVYVNANVIVNNLYVKLRALAHSGPAMVLSHHTATPHTYSQHLHSNCHAVSSNPYGTAWCSRTTPANVCVCLGRHAKAYILPSSTSLG